MLFGPFTLLLDSDPENKLWGIALLVVCVAAFVTAIVWPRQWSLGLAVLAVILWLVVGRLGVGINC